MKKLVLLLIILVLLTGCTNNKKPKNLVETKNGTYKITGLVKREDLSTEETDVYCLKKDKEEKKPDNVRVGERVNVYTIKNNLAFKNYIPDQLKRDFGNDIQIKGITLTTSKNNLVYKFNVIKENDESEITLYFIIGDYKYIIVNETNYSKNPDFDDAVYKLVDSFKWER